MERYECLNCCNTDLLDIHGRCQHCGSRQVIAESRIQLGMDLASTETELTAVA